MVRLCDCEPAPHDLVQVDQVSHVPTMQLTGHACTLHARVSAECAQALPPDVGCVCARLRDCEPPPHDLVHVDQLPRLSSTQSVAHAWLLHACVSSACGQASPPFWGGVWVRLRFCEPPPHDLVHADQAAQSLETQLAGQAWLLHVRDSSPGHAMPPWLWYVSMRADRDWVPPAHDAVHAPQVPHWWTQSIGHAWLLQVRCAVHSMVVWSQVVGHAVPPFSCQPATARTRCCTLSPHDLPQALHGP